MWLLKSPGLERCSELRYGDVLARCAPPRIRTFMSSHRGGRIRVAKYSSPASRPPIAISSRDTRNAGMCRPQLDRLYTNLFQSSTRLPVFARRRAVGDGWEFTRVGRQQGPAPRPRRGLGRGRPACASSRFSTPVGRGFPSTPNIFVTSLRWKPCHLNMTLTADSGVVLSRIPESKPASGSSRWTEEI
jgi:hypothetical protein